MDDEATKEEDQDVRLCAALRGLLGGSKYAKQSLAAKCCYDMPSKKGTLCLSSCSRSQFRILAAAYLM